MTKNHLNKLGKRRQRSILNLERASMILKGEIIALQTIPGADTAPLQQISRDLDRQIQRLKDLTPG